MNDGQVGIGNPGMGPTPQMRQAIIDAPLVQCECGSHTFSNAVVLKKVPGLFFGETEPIIYPVNVYVCTECGKIMSEQLADKDFINLVGKDMVNKMSEGRTVPTYNNEGEQTKQTIKPLFEV